MVRGHSLLASCDHWRALHSAWRAETVRSAGERQPDLERAPAGFSQFWFAGVLEVFGGILIVLGLFTRPVAFLLSGEMAVAYFQAHFPRNFWPVLNGGENVVLFCFVFLYLFVTGAGPYSLDALLRSRRHLHASSADRTARDRRPAVAAERL
jgi:uncharacterized membrane protein YphA (DoxX/SURF4 family)